MPRTLDRIYDSATKLPVELQVQLAERIIGNIASQIDPENEKLQLAEAKKRRDELKSGAVSGIDGKEALHRVRKLLK